MVVVCTAIEVMFVAQYRVCVISTQMALAMASTGASTIFEYFSKMKVLADKMASGVGGKA